MRRPFTFAPLIVFLYLGGPVEAASGPTPEDLPNDRWTATGGVLLYGSSGDATYGNESTAMGFLGVGGRIGVRYWMTRYLIGTALVEYGFLTWVNELDDKGLPGDSSDRWRKSHSIALLSRVELASFDKRSEAFSVPEFSLYPVAGPVFMLGGGPQSGVGYRLGLGLGGAPAGTKFYSFSLDLAFQHLFFEELTLKSVLFSLGVFAF